MEKFILALAIQPILYFIADFIISGSIYLVQEINHSVRKMKRSFKECCWEMEWKIKHWR